MNKPMLSRVLVNFAWVQSFAAMVGSLYFSQILQYPPCVLCWYQRIAMYPIVLIIPVGIFLKDKHLPYYVLPLSIIGVLIAAYHNLLYWNIIPEAITPCMAGVSCTTQYIEWFGFVTIPFLSFMAFAAITACMLLYKKLNR